ncbi:MAG: selenide, water dikinase SelD, partial [Lachnospiraceae bacterium]|nr:selenide, water dikinase SelD [Lachnospiraceae bacterium]
MAQVLRQLPVQQDPDLLVGFDTSDDAAVYKITDDIAMIQTVDIFPPVVDDPYSYGQIAAANSLSDVYAMGGKPKLAMNILCIPEDLDPEITKAILQGGYSKAAEAGAVICGGHTIKDKEPKYGLCVSGFVHPDHILTNSSAKPGDVLVLTKAIGTGILNTAIKADLLEADTIAALTESMASLNKAAAAAMEGLPVHSCTDITGFGLLGHVYEMAHGSGTIFVLESSKIPFLPQALEMAEMGIVPAGAYNNRRWISCSATFGPGVPLAVEDALFDP